MEEERVIREEGEKNQNNFKNGQLRESREKSCRKKEGINKKSDLISLTGH